MAVSHERAEQVEWYRIVEDVRTIFVNSNQNIYIPDLSPRA